MAINRPFPTNIKTHPPGGTNLWCNKRPLHPIMEAYIDGHITAKTVNLYHLLKKLKVTL